MQGRHDETQEAAELMQKSLQMFKNLKVVPLLLLIVMLLG